MTTLSLNEKEKMLLNTCIQNIDNCIYNNTLIDVLEYEKNNNKSIGSNYLRKVISKIDYSEQIKKNIGELQKIPLKQEESEEYSIEKLDDIVGNIKDFKLNEFSFNLSRYDYRYLEDIINNELIHNMIKKDSNYRIQYMKKRDEYKDLEEKQIGDILLKKSLNEDLEIDIDLILEYIYKLSPEMDAELYINNIRDIIKKIYTERYKDEIIVDFNKWCKENIRMYKTLPKTLNRKTENLGTILLIRKFIEDSSKKKKYIIYDFSNVNNKYIKKSYTQFMDTLKKENRDICFKFQKNNIGLKEKLQEER